MLGKKIKDQQLTHQSWGRYPRAIQDIYTPDWSFQAVIPTGSKKVLPYGLGRSYGDSCLNDAGTLIDTSRLNHLLIFDESTGILRCEGGATLLEILEAFVPRGWFLPVTPGTKYVTIGGAIANDVHGKNHHRAGTFGRFVERFELLRSDGSRFLCSPKDNPEMFRATVGGLGLTGLILWADIKLRRIESSEIELQTIRFSSLEEFVEVSDESERDFEYTVAWVDTLATGHNLGRGIFMRGNHAGASTENRKIGTKSLHPNKVFPFDAPGWLLNRWSVRAFNSAYFFAQGNRRPSTRVHFDPFFYPLDSIRDWNRMYGSDGFFQYQLLIPKVPDLSTLKAIFRTITASKSASFLSVLKTFGKVASPGLMSFPREGITLALDFRNSGSSTLQLLNQLDALVIDAGGSVYPAKDARMSAESFAAFFPQWKEFSAFVDPHFSSSFWRRVSSNQVTN